MLGSLSHMLGVVALCKKTTMNRRMKRLHATIHHFGELSYLIDGGNGNTCFCNDASRATRRDDLSTELFGQSTSEFHHARLVRYRHKNTLYLRICHLVPPFRIAWFTDIRYVQHSSASQTQTFESENARQRAVQLVSLK